MDEELLAGGIANAGAVVRVGAHVLRPSNPHTATIHAFLSELRAGGFEGASNPVGVDADGRERLEFIPGDVPVPPFPAWARSDDVLASIAALLARFHRAATDHDTAAGTWSDEMADPLGGTVICHNDVCPENVVFRDGVAVALLDFDFCAPGRPVYDLARCVQMCVPVDDDTSAARVGFDGENRPDRLRIACDSYGLTADERVDLLGIVDQLIANGGTFVRRRVEAGDPNFIAVWQAMGGEERFDRRRRWWDAHRSWWAAALT